MTARTGAARESARRGAGCLGGHTRHHARARRPLIALLIICAACVASPWAGVPPLEEPEYAVYRAALDRLGSAGDSLPVLETLGPFPLDSGLAQVRPEYQEARQALLHAEPRRLDPGQIQPLPLRVVPFAHFRRLVKQGDSVLTLSRVGFSRDSTHALLHLSAACRFCGTSTLFFLRRDASGRWAVERSRILWRQQVP